MRWNNIFREGKVKGVEEWKEHLQLKSCIDDNEDYLR